MVVCSIKAIVRDRRDEVEDKGGKGRPECNDPMITEIKVCKLAFSRALEQRRYITSMSWFSLSMRTINPVVHGKSLGLCPLPTALTTLPSTLANSSIHRHSSSVEGWKAVVGTEAYERAQFLYVEREEEVGMMTVARRSRS